MRLRLEDLPANPDAVRQMALHLAHENEFLHEALRLMRARQFGAQSERVVWDGNLEELFLFAESGSPAKERPAPEATSKIPVAAHKRKKTGRKPLPEHLPRVVEVVDVPEADKICNCGQARPRIGQEVSEQLDVIPARAQVRQRIRPKYGPCSHCEGTADEPSPSVLIAPVPPQIIPKSVAYAGLIAYILTAKFVDSTPFYRQERQFLRMGVEVKRGSMCGWAIKVAQACARLMDFLREEVLAGPVVGVDETTLQVLKEPGRHATTESYLWHFRGGLPGRETLFYLYAATRAGAVAKDFLKGYRGGVQADGFSGYDWLDKIAEIIHLGCMAHLRRYFMDVLKAASKPLHALKHTLAGEAVERIKALYLIEQVGREAELSRDELRDLRQNQAKPLLVSFHAWLEEKKPLVPPKGLTGKAIGYALNQWPRIERYVDDGAYFIDNNRTYAARGISSVMPTAGLCRVGGHPGAEGPALLGAPDSGWM